MDQQLPLVPFLRRRCPDPRKIILQQQIQNVGCVATVRLLFAHLRGPDLGRVADPNFMTHRRQHVHKPMAVARRLQPHPHRPAQSAIELLGFSGCVHQLSFPCFSSFRIQPTNLLPTGMEITTYNDHLKAPFFPVVFVVKQRILCRTGPSLLSNQSFVEKLRGFCSFVTKGGLIECRHAERIASLVRRRRIPLHHLQLLSPAGFS